MAQEESTRGVSLYTRRVWIALGAVALLAGLAALVKWLLTAVLILFAALLFGVFLNQLSRRIERATGLPYRVALGVVALLLVLTAGGTLYTMGSQIVAQAATFSSQLTSALQEGWGRIEGTGIGQWLEDQGLDQKVERKVEQAVEATVEKTVEKGAATLPTRVLSALRAVVLWTISALGGVVVVAIVGFYLAVAPDKYREGLVRLFPPARRSRVDEVVRMVAHSLWAWILGRLIAMLVIGVGSAIGLWIIGIPLPIANGVLAGILNFIPNLGPLLSMAPPALLGLQQGGYAPLYVIGFYIVLQFIEAYLLTPLIDGNQVSLPAGLILVAQLLFGLMGGFLGLMLATPIAAVLFVLVREFYVKDTLERDVADSEAAN